MQTYFEGGFHKKDFDLENFVYSKGVGYNWINIYFKEELWNNYLIAQIVAVT